MKKIVTVSIFVLFAIVVAISYSSWESFVNKAASENSEELIYEVPLGKSLKSIASDLEREGAIKNANLFVFFAKLKGATSKIKVGEYLINKNQKPNEILNIICSGKSIEKKLTIAEGLNIFEIADIFEKAGLGTKDEIFKYISSPETAESLLGEKASSLEGYLYPETYNYTKYMNYKSVISEMIKKFKEKFAEIQSKNPDNLNLKEMTRHQIITLASIIEKETGASSERPLISSIFHNRLNKNMKLQTDPTILYGKALSTGNYEIKISKADLIKFNPYNTYVINGLPPGPVASPGKEAIEAAINPAQSEFLFFVSKNDGTHFFSKDYKTHQNAVLKLQIDPKAREGKSWRDLKKKKL